MSTEPNDYSDFHGDGDNSIEFDHHPKPDRWTKRDVIWSISMIGGMTIVGTIIILMMYGVI